MKKHYFTAFEFLGCLIILTAVISYTANIIQLCRCDFEAPWKPEVVHAIGVFIPPAAIVTAWFGV